MSMEIDEQPVAGPSNSHETDEAAPTSAQVPLFFPEDDDDEQGEEGDWTDSDTEDDPVVKVRLIKIWSQVLKDTLMLSYVCCRASLCISTHHWATL